MAFPIFIDQLRIHAEIDLKEWCKMNANNMFYKYNGWFISCNMKTMKV